MEQHDWLTFIVCREHLLGMSSGITELGGIQWEVAGCLALAWFLTFLALSKGVKSVGKVMEVAASMDRIEYVPKIEQRTF